MQKQDDLIILTPQGLFCPPGNFYIDPWLPVEKAIITHAHADHARIGNQSYLTAAPGKLLLQARLGEAARIETMPYGETIHINGVQISFHPAGHILGSAQIKLIYAGKTWVVTGDYKLESDRTCEPFQSVKCNVLISEATFALPIYVWKPQQTIFEEINAWWRYNQSRHKTSILLGYALGKAQRILSGLDPIIGPIYTHGAVEKLTQVYRNSGVFLPATAAVSDQIQNTDWSKGIVLAPPSALIPAWLKRFGDYSIAFASGWMRVRGARRLRNFEQGFVLSDHADWPGLLKAISESGAERVLVTHGQTEPIVRYLNEQGIFAQTLETHFGETNSEDTSII